jgi:hypothetical protein
MGVNGTDTRAVFGFGFKKQEDLQGLYIFFSPLLLLPVLLLYDTSSSRSLPQHSGRGRVGWLAKPLSFSQLKLSSADNGQK